MSHLAQLLPQHSTFGIITSFLQAEGSFALYKLNDSAHKRSLDKILRKLLRFVTQSFDVWLPEPSMRLFSREGGYLNGDVNSGVTLKLGNMAFTSSTVRVEVSPTVGSFL